MTGFDCIPGNCSICKGNGQGDNLNLIKNKGFSEDEAYKKIQHQSMNLRKSMREIAEAIILANEIEG
ncbi:MAG: ANTAR domain-containing protein [Candidatus Desantisbacteria bacterium]